MPEDINPYQTPKTSAAVQPTRFKHITADQSEPFVSQDGFYCKPSFKAPLMCFLSGVNLPESTPLTELRTDTGNTIALYFDPLLIRSNSLNSYLVKICLYCLLIIAICVIFLISNIIVAIVVGLILIFYVIPKAKPKLTVNDAQNGYIRLTGGHQHFLKNYPQKELPYAPQIEFPNSFIK